ncbi:MAG TPA: Ig-like domain-containing protein [Gemmatimonadaceae bacterium]|nr:Ig-like domain-containing protein [Gemmatimonadaceae bacterium]
MLRRPFRTLVGLALLAGCSGTEPDPVATTVRISPPVATVEMGSTTQLSVEVRDQRDEPMTGRPIVWTSANLSIASVASGLVTGMSPGVTRVIATVDGRAAEATVTVTALPVAAVVITNHPLSLIAGQAASLGATLSDRLGNVLTGRTVEWSTSAPEIATVDASGRVQGVAAGTATITATSEGVRGSASLVVMPIGTPPVLGGITPQALVPGQPATIAGTGFDATATRNVVTLGGVNAPIVAATATELLVTVPCVPGGAAELRVATNNATSVPLATTVTVPQRTLAVGQTLVLSPNSQAGCNELVGTGSARYVVSVFSASTSANALVDFELSGNPAPPGAEPPRFSAVSPRLVEAHDPATDAARARDLAHLQAMERERARYEALRARRGSAPAARRAAVAAPLPTMGEMRGITFTFTAGCGDTTRVVRGKAIYVGTRAVIWEDSTNTLQSSADAQLAGYYERLGQIFDRDQYEVIRATFGDPLRRDALTDGDGRVHMVFTQRLNGTGAAAYVTSCDQFPRTMAAGSNFGEYFYGAVPTTSGRNLTSTAYPDGWFYFMARTVVHEVKHIASMAARVANDAPTLEQSWLEEGTARHAEEVWVRQALHNVAWKANTGWGSAASNGLYCDFHPENEVCNAADALRRPSYGMRRQFNELREKLVQPWNWSVYGDGVGQGGSVFYQTVWSLVRYAIDRHGASDATFLGALTNASTNGTTNLAAVAGVPMDQLIGTWSLALYTDDHPALQASHADLQIPTWNLRSIYAGLNADPTWATRWATPYPVQALQLPFGAFSTQQQGLRGGANAYYELSGTMSGRQLLSLRALLGNGASLRMAVARLQ